MSLLEFGFEPCIPCLDSWKDKHGIPHPHWRGFIIEEDGVKRLGTTCKEQWGFMSCPASPRNAEIDAMTKKEKDDWLKPLPLFPIMDLAERFDMLFEV